jgi:hypothetical protein
VTAARSMVELARDERAGRQKQRDLTVDTLVDRDMARDLAVALEQQLAAVDVIHEPQRYCIGHSITEHPCGTGWWWRCFECRSHSRETPCRTWLSTHPLWAEGVG